MIVLTGIAFTAPVLAFTPPPPPAPLAAGASLEGLETALRDRIVALQILQQQTGLTPVQGQELDGLHRALQGLLAYTGSLGSYFALLDPLDMSAETAELIMAKQDSLELVAAASGLQDSQTQDPAILMQAMALIDTLDGIGLEARQFALAVLNLLADPELPEAVAGHAAGDGFSATSLVVQDDDKNTVQNLVTTGDKLRNIGLGNWAGDMGQGAWNLASAWVYQHEASALGRTLYAGALAANPVSLTPVSAVPQLPPGFEVQPDVPFDVDVVVALDRPVPELSMVLHGFLGGDQLQSTLGELTRFNVEPDENGLFTETMTATFPTFAAEDVLAFDEYKAGPLAVDGNTVVIGEPSLRRAQLLERIEGGIWQTVGIQNGFEFNFLGLGLGESNVGRSVAIDGNTALIGSPGDGTVSDRVLVLERTGPGSPFVKVDELVAPGGFFFADEFGWSVDISGDTLVIGDWDRARAYVYTRSGGTWSMTTELSDVVRDQVPGAPLTRFGWSVAIDGNMIVVGDPAEASAWVFVGPDWSIPVVQDFGFLCLSVRLTGWLTPPDSAAGSEFGHSVGVAGDVVAVGSPGYDGAGSDAGVVYIRRAVPIDIDGGTFGCDTFGLDLVEEATLTASGPMPNDRYGQSVAIATNTDGSSDVTTVVVGAPGRDHSGLANAGSSYIWAEDFVEGCHSAAEGGFSGTWGLVARRDALAPAPYQQYGQSVATSGDSIVVGKPNGQVTTYRGMIPVFPGAYRIGLEVDPFDRLPEPTDALPCQDCPAPFNPVGGDPCNGMPQVVQNCQSLNLWRPGNDALNVALCSPASNQPRLTIESFELIPYDEETEPAEAFLIADPSGMQLSPAGLNVTVAMNGSFDGSLAGAYLTTDMLVQGQSGAGTFLDAHTGEYTDRFMLPTMKSGDAVSVSVDVRYAGPALSGTPTDPAADYDLTVNASVKPPMNVANFAPMSEWRRTLTDQHWTVLNLVSCSYNAAFEKQMGNDDYNVTADFAVSLDHSGDFSAIEYTPPGGYPDGNPANLYPEAYGSFGAIGALAGGVDLTLFGIDLGSLIRWRTMIERDPTNTWLTSDPVLTLQYPPLVFPELYEEGAGYSFLASDLYFLNPFTLQQDLIYAVGPYDSIDLSILSTVLPEGMELSQGGFTYEVDLLKDTSFAEKTTKEFSKEKTFFPGGLPVTVKGEVKGRIGLDVELEVTNTLGFDIKPIVELGATANLEVGDCDFTCVGAEGELAIVSDEFGVESKLCMFVREADDAQGIPGKALGAAASFKVANTIKILDGELKAFAVWPWIKWCSAWGIPYPCGGYQKKATYEIIDWDGLEYEQVLFEFPDPDDPPEALCCVPIADPDFPGFIDCDDPANPDPCDDDD